MTQKILQVGSSAAVTIPKKALSELGMAIGDEISVVIDTENKRVVIESPVAVDPELAAWTKGFIEKYRPALEALKDK
jgi:antitoxin component of MazEF toxin-antitoxin module